MATNKWTPERIVNVRKMASASVFAKGANFLTTHVRVLSETLHRSMDEIERQRAEIAELRAMMEKDSERYHAKVRSND